ncbi:hypothetical protein DFQ27_000872 [Actinomortierella ambigua]|uniref:Uncharacterized protein n=1 Tax=Actinomortierella ambigua TaxID=1343610 RepID=A0A9P6QDY9_9FUNG|nr:hypothetical protein DFQ27_000872 [Actinomortierella ambigua]
MKSFVTTGLAILGALSIATTSVKAQLLTTPGMIVRSPYQNMGVYQGGYMAVSFQFQNLTVGGTTVTMAKKDGSGNTTLYTVPDTESKARFLESYDVPATLEVGDYRVSIVAKPGSGTLNPSSSSTPTAPSNLPRSSTGSATAAPTAALAWENDGFVIMAAAPTGANGGPTPPGAPSVYYFAADVRVLSANEKPKNAPSSAMTLTQSAGQIAWKAAAAMGFVALVAVNM